MDPLLQRNKIQIWWNKRMKWCYQLQRDNAHFSLTCNSTSKWDWWFDHMQFYCLSHLKPADLNINWEVYFLSSFWLSLLLFNKTVEGSESDNCTVRHPLLRWNRHCIRNHSEILSWLPPSKLLLRRNTIQKTQVSLQCKKCGSISICRFHMVVLLVLLWYFLFNTKISY